MRRLLQTVACALAALGLLGATARATVLVPMRDEALVASSDAIVVGRVDGVSSALLADGRIVTRITLAVERALKGGPADGDTVVVTESGGRVGHRVVVILGAPEYGVGERVLAFLRRRADGSLETNALALGKYHIEADAAGVPRARRTVPGVEERALAPFADRIAALAAARAGVRTDGRAGIAVAPPVLDDATAAFAFNGMQPARWFEADCGDPVSFSLGNVDASFGDAASRAAVLAATAAWTAVAGAALRLGVGPDATPAPSLLAGSTDGRNTIQFEDPFGEVGDLVGCSGVLARGGYAAIVGDDDPTLSRTVSSITFGRIVEGDVTLNQGLGACPFDAAALAEVVAHELGHAIGFGHSSENPDETDPVLADALMYFRIHADGRGASVRQDDVAGMLIAYPDALVAATPLDRLSCRAGLGLVAATCFGKTLPGKPFARFARARGAVTRALHTAAVAKQRKLLGKAIRALDKTDRALLRGVPGDCGTQLRALVADLRARATAVLAGL